jgi:eukaryotic translation initiation factor 2C
MVQERLLAWVSGHGGALPTSLLFYRDGVSESQFQACLDQEVPSIRNAYQNLGGNPNKLQLTYVIVGKRHNTRFYAITKRDTYTEMVKLNPKDEFKTQITNGNLKPGLFVDNVVTNPTPYNFFLQSHSAIKGTARSAHYHVLTDGMSLGRNLPNITMMLCCAFGRATKGVSYVAPAYIADRLCERGRAYLRQWNEGNGFTKPAKSNNQPYTKEGTKRWKAARALELARDSESSGTPNRIWGHFDDTNSKDRRLNPWHPRLDGNMFWM